MNTPLQTLDLAQARFQHRWLHHYALGDPSWDTFTRDSGNPIYVGKEPYLWPVNGFLFRDPPTGRWYAYVGLYPRGYWPAGPCLTLRECAKGECAKGECAKGGWEEVGLAIQGDAGMFDGDGRKPGMMPDISVVYAGGRYHMAYDWANPDNTRGGIAYAWAEQPEGPFHRALAPIHEDTFQQPILGRYVRAYAATLLQRQNDWIILHDMSTPGNAGGTWAMACMTASDPAGPYSAPTLLLYPQSDRFLPPLMEYYPAFAHAGFIYAPATSVALNRNFQCMFRAPIEQAHQPDAWELYQYGSVWHAEATRSEAKGIWGQTFSAQVDSSGDMRAYYTCKTSEDIGTVHMARRPWNKPYRDGFVLSAPNAPALAVLRQHYDTFKLDVKAQADGTWSICWQCIAPFGPDKPTADAAAHPLVNAPPIQWMRDGDQWRLASMDESGAVVEHTGVCRQPASGIELIRIQQDATNVNVTVNGQQVCVMAHTASPGRLQLLAEQGTLLRVDHFELTGNSRAANECWLATEALAGAGTGADETEWLRTASDQFRYGCGYVSARPNARAKWNYHGEGFRLYSPRGPGYGKAEIVVDGRPLGTTDFYASEPQHSALLVEHHLPGGYHAVTLQAIRGVIPCDVLEVFAVSQAES